MSLTITTSDPNWDKVFTLAPGDYVEVHGAGGLPIKVNRNRAEDGWEFSERVALAMGNRGLS